MEHITHNKKTEEKVKQGNYSMFHVPCYVKESSVGFTIIEMLVVVSITAVLVAVLIGNFPQFKLQLSLPQVAYKFGQDVRRAQSMSLASLQYKDAEGVLQPVKGYGVYIDMATNPKKYILYADNVAGNQQYDQGIDYIIETVDFSATEKGIIIKQMDNIVGNAVSINFAPPNPTTTITTLAQNQNSVNVVFAIESDLTKTKTVSVNTVGLIEVK